MANLCCSIETEPRTLNGGQLNHAREAAFEIVQKKDSNEASNIFIEGLRPVASKKEMEGMVERRDQLQKIVECKETAQDIERSCGCSCTSTSTDESSDKTKIREPLSAPF